MAKTTFTIQGKDSKSNARAGVFSTFHGNIETPIFMPVGTRGTVKGIHQRELLNDVEAQIILGNTYHLFLRPGVEVIQKAQGLHNFMNWKKPLLTDSGGYQVFSLSDRRKISEEGVQFFSHIDGSSKFLSPENSIQIQKHIGADIIMAFDECPPYPFSHENTKQSLERTLRWLKRCFDEMERFPQQYSHSQALFPIIQGSTYKDLRELSAKKTLEFDSIGYAIGGLSVGEPHELMYDMTKIVCNLIPDEKARYLMGVGTPENILECISHGIDMFDCVMPTRNGRNGMIFTWDGIMNIKNKKWEFDFSELDSKGKSFVDTYYSKSYVRHLFHVHEFLGAQIASLHNLAFYIDLVKTARKKILSKKFFQWKETVIPKLKTRL